MSDTSEDVRLFFDGARDVLYTQDLSGRITRVNHAFELVTGYSKDEAEQMNILDLVTPEHRRTISEQGMAAFGGACGATFEMEIRTRAGDSAVLQASAEPVFRDGRPVGIQTTARDLTGRKREVLAHARTEAELLEKTRQLDNFTRYLQLLHRLSTTSYHDLDELFADYLRAGCEIFGLSNGAILEYPTMRVLASRAGAPADNIPSEIPDFRHANPCSAGASILVDGRTFGGIVFWCEDCEDSPAMHPHGREIIELMAKAIGSAIHQRQLTDLLAYQAKHDSLTALPNRLLLYERLETALDAARQSGSMVAVAFIDLDMFKQINDTLGHAVGDGVLQHVGRRLASCMHEGDTLARMGGDEFTAVLSAIEDEAAAVAYLRTLMNSVRAPCRVQDYELFVTASVGISFFPTDGEDAATLLRNADAAMYSAKYRGKNDVRCYQAEVTATALERLELETHLRRALERDELRLLYQPQVDLAGKIAGLEVLLAWEHPERGRISPTQFIPIAEETGMILPIGAWVLRRACSQLAEWRRRLNVRTSIAVNVSALQFAQANFVQNVAETLEECGLPGNCLELELTESLVMRDVEQSASIMRELRALGLRIAIDDFGTGYSSLSYLRRLPADTLKIDQSFVSGIDRDESAFALVSAVAVLGHAFHLQVTAEGVETERQFDLVRKAGCDRVQGHLFGGALSVERTEDLLLD